MGRDDLHDALRDAQPDRSRRDERLQPDGSREPGDRFPITVEDVLAYFQLASEQGKDEAALASDAFHRLAESVHPLALGNVKRSIEQIWQPAKKSSGCTSPAQTTPP